MALTAAFDLLRHDTFTKTLAGIALVIIVARAAGVVFDRLHQPPVIGEVIAGLALGPTVLGSHSYTLFAADERPLLKMLATVGLVIFMFLIGLELDLGELARRRWVAVGVGSMGTVIPFGFGVILGLVLYRDHETVDSLSFVLFIGVALSITAFPVLVRILRERGLYQRPLGAVATASAAVDDVLTWATLAFVLAIISSSGGWWDLPYVAGASILFTILMIKVVKPVLRRYESHEVDPTALTIVVASIFLSSWITSATGTHEIFGAFLLGSVFPRGEMSKALRRQLQSLTHILLPVFFVTVGLNVDIGRVGTDGAWQFALILFMACSGKVLGGFIGSYSQGVPARESLALGVIVNTRGLTELIVLNIGRDLGILDDVLFTLFVCMAIVTTVATGPLLTMIDPDPDLTGRRGKTEVGGESTERDPSPD